MSSLAYQRQNSRAKQRGPEVRTMSFREKLQRKLHRLDLDKITRARLRHLIQEDPVAAMREMAGMKREVERCPK